MGSKVCWPTLQVIIAMQCAALQQPSRSICLDANLTDLLLAARETIVGWYSTGPKLRASDLDINSLMSNYCSDPVLVICEVQVQMFHSFVYQACLVLPSACTS